MIDILITIMLILNTWTLVQVANCMKYGLVRKSLLALLLAWFFGSFIAVCLFVADLLFPPTTEEETELHEYMLECLPSNT